MPIYENKSDRYKQSIAAKAIQNYLGNLYRVEETPTEDRQCNDLEIYYADRLVQIGEVKARTPKAWFFKSNPWLIENERIEALIKKARRLGIDEKSIAMFLKTSDNCVAGITYGHLLENQNLLEKADPKMLKNDHGTKPAPNKTGFLVPWRLLTMIERHGTG